MQKELFENNSLLSPLAHRLRPKDLEDFYGQDEVIKKIASLSSRDLNHYIFYGPPGVGKTTLALIMASRLDLNFVTFNAVMSGVPELRKIIKEIIDLKKFQSKRSILFIDEIHRFNKAQQDSLLPHLEKGDFIFLGATTEYPQISLNKAILSRVSVLELKKLTQGNIIQILKNAARKTHFEIKPEYLESIAKFSNGDARFAINKLEEFSRESEKSLDVLLKILNRAGKSYDKNSERHYDVISAFIKSIRGSDVDSAILWLAVMIDGGEDPEFIARRLIILASEDIGNADPRGLQMATSAHYAVKHIGMPEARITLAQVTTYLARAPKSHSSYMAINKAMDFVKNNPTVEVPTHLRNHHPDKKNYLYPHNYENHFVKQVYRSTPDRFFESGVLGYEKLQSDFEKKNNK